MSANPPPLILEAGSKSDSSQEAWNPAIPAFSPVLKTTNTGNSNTAVSQQLSQTRSAASGSSSLPNAFASALCIVDKVVYSTRKIFYFMHGTKLGWCS